MKRLFSNGTQQVQWQNILGNFEKLFLYSNPITSNSIPLNESKLAPIYNALKKQRHPLLNTIQNAIHAKKYWGTILLLLSKTSKHETSQLRKKIEKLALAIEYLRMAQRFHKSLLCIPHNNDLDTINNDITAGNKAAILGGSWILAQAHYLLAEIRNPVVFEMISNAFRNMMEEEFFGSLPPRFDNTASNSEENIHSALQNPAIQDWEQRNIQHTAYLLAQSCRATTILSNFEEDIQKHASKFGENVALASKAQSELMYFTKLPHNHTIDKFDLTSAPVMLHLQYDPSMSEEIQKTIENHENVNYQKIYNEIQCGPSFKLTANLVEYYLSKAIIHLREFPDSEARTLLYNIVLSMENSSK